MIYLIAASREDAAAAAAEREVPADGWTYLDGAAEGMVLRPGDQLARVPGWEGRDDLRDLERGVAVALTRGGCTITPHGAVVRR